MNDVKYSLPVSQLHSVSREGFAFDPSSRCWHLSRDRSIDLNWAYDSLSPLLAGALISVLAHYAGSYSAAHTSNLYDRFKYLAKFLAPTREPIGQITCADLINFRSSLGREREWYLSHVGGLFKTWVNLGLPGVDSQIPSLLQGWKIRGNIKGRAVQLQCPISGALTDLEYEALQQRLLAAYENDEVELGDFVILTLFMATGRRPVQIGDLKCKDLIEARSSDGLREFVLNVPRRKQRVSNWRSDFKPVALTPETGIALQGLILKNHLRLKELCPSANTDIAGELPIFPVWSAIRNAANASESLFASKIGAQAFHNQTNSLSIRLEKLVATLDVQSERTGQKIRVFPTRLRRTLATRAAREGYGSLIIAELLDHTDDQNARVYTENVPEHVDAINDAVARQLAPLAQAFAGLLVDNELEAQRGSDPSSRVRTDSGKCAGSCGHFGFCGAHAPIACYTCRHFQPWIDGAHVEVLQMLKTERKRIAEITRDSVVASINDRTIFAVTEVIQRCEVRQAEIPGGKKIG
jgi:integrase